MASPLPVTTATAVTEHFMKLIYDTQGPEVIMEEEPSVNISQQPATTEEHQVIEGGFLSGRNPFMFVADAPLPTFIIQLLVIVIMSRIVKFILSPIKQPAVIAEIVSGILLGPTALGRLPYFTDWVFPKASLPFLNLMSNFGLVLFLFLVGLELDPRMLKKSIKNSLLISVAGMVLPFSLGCGASYVLYQYIEPEEFRKSFLSYLLFLGVAISITAFPVLARILSEMNLLKTKVGGITISAAAVDDTTSWCLLALVISIIHANNSNLIAIYVFLMGLGYSLFLILVLRPILISIFRRAGVFERETPSQLSIFMALMVNFASAFITDAIGIHAIFGGFLAGLIMPHENGFAFHITEKLEDCVQILFLPLYFALSGLKTKIGTLDDILSWAVVALVVVCSCCGKIFGCTFAARWTNLNWRESFTVGFLMNCKGLVELIVLNLGYDAGIISDKTFAIMVIMALVTTFITVPAVSFLYPEKYHDKPGGAIGTGKGSSGLLLSVNKMEQVAPILGVISILQPHLGAVSDKRKCKKKKKLDTSSGVTINVLRLIELTERDSCVMLQTSEDCLRYDPITNLVKKFLEPVWKKSAEKNQVHGMVKVVTVSRFGEAMAECVDETQSKFVLLPWSGSGSIIDDNRRESLIAQAMAGNAGRRRLSVHTPIKHANFFHDLLSKVKLATVLILVDRGTEVRGQCESSGDEGDRENEIIRKGNLITFTRIFLPFFGGRDDREALELIMGLGEGQGPRHLEIRVVWYRRTGCPKNVYSIEPEDEEAVNLHFGSPSTGKYFSQVDCINPVESATQDVGQFGEHDLVVIGRRNYFSRLQSGFTFRMDDVERRRALGDVAEAILSSNPESKVSFLVVQGPRQPDVITTPNNKNVC